MSVLKTVFCWEIWYAFQPSNSCSRSSLRGCCRQANVTLEKHRIWYLELGRTVWSAQLLGKFQPTVHVRSFIGEKRFRAQTAHLRIPTPSHESKSFKATREETEDERNGGLSTTNQYTRCACTPLMLCMTNRSRLEEVLKINRKAGNNQLNSLSDKSETIWKVEPHNNKIKKRYSVVLNFDGWRKIMCGCRKLSH